MWVVQRALESEMRPPARTVLDRLKECVDDWGGSIVPLVPKSWQEDGRCHMSPSERYSLSMSLLPQQGA